MAKVYKTCGRTSRPSMHELQCIHGHKAAALAATGMKQGVPDVTVDEHLACRFAEDIHLLANLRSAPRTFEGLGRGFTHLWSFVYAFAYVRLTRAILVDHRDINFPLSGSFSSK